MREISYVRGDATDPQGEGPKFIIHCCNTLGLWGAGFVMAVSRRWAKPEEEYYSLVDQGHGCTLGLAQIVKVDEDLYVINMIGQEGVGRQSGGPPIRYWAIKTALNAVAKACLDPTFRGPYKSVSVHAPRFGAGLAGGDWNTIERIINETLIAKEIPVTVYDFDG